MNKKTNALEVEKLVKFLGKKQILFDVSICISEGEVFGFLGPNGAGKTTTMKCLLGLLHPDYGNVRILGDEHLSDTTKHMIGFMPENTYLYRYLTGREFLRFNGNFFTIPKSMLETKIEELLEKVGLLSSADKLLATYSKGMLQRIGLAQSIINDPKIVFLDEPMSGLDPIGRKMVKDLILELKSKGTTVFFNTHILSDVESLCDRFAIIHHGRIISEGSLQDLNIPLEEFFIKQVQGS